jgi:hypothetical protein
VVDVGGTPPPKLNALQVALSPDYQNVTFGVLGVAVTIVGGAITIGRTRSRISRLQRQLDAIEEIRMLSIERPRGAARALRDRHDRLPRELAQHHIDEAQRAILEAQTLKLLRTLRIRLLPPTKRGSRPTSGGSSTCTSATRSS